MSRNRVRQKPNKRAARGANARSTGEVFVETTVFRSGNSDAVRLPTRFGLLGQRVRVRRLENGGLLIEPKRKRGWPSGFLNSFGQVTEDFTPPARPASDATDDIRLTTVFRSDSE